jgi:hypothetical protein
MMCVLWAVGAASQQVSSSLATRDWLVPAISGAAGVIGALGAQTLGRRAQLSVEKLRGKREESLAIRREGHELEAEKRLARGIAAALMKALEYQKSALDAADTSGQWWNDERKMELDLPRSEQVALASWIGDPAWGVIVAPFLMLTDVDASRALAKATGGQYKVGQFQPTKDAIDIAVGVLRLQISGTLRASVTTADGTG